MSYTIEDLKALKGRKLEKEIEALELDLEKKSLENDWNRLQVEGASMKAADARASQDLNHIYHFFGSVKALTATDCIEITGQWSRRDPGCDITIILNSPGGDVIEGLAVYDHLRCLRRAGHHITIVARGMAASMGGILLQAGDERVMDTHAFMLIHEISAGAVGKASEMEDMVKFIDKLQQKGLEILAERSSLTVRQIRKRWARKDWWLDAQEALELGFVDRIDG